MIVLDYPEYTRGLLSRLPLTVRDPNIIKELSKRHESMPDGYAEHPLEIDVQEEDIRKLVTISCILAGAHAVVVNRPVLAELTEVSGNMVPTFDRANNFRHVWQIPRKLQEAATYDDRLDMATVSKYCGILERYFQPVQWHSGRVAVAIGAFLAYALRPDEGQGYAIRTLVAFSGEVHDPESGPDAFTEHSATLNPNLKGRDIREAFKEPHEYQILLVANKFQTGFDRPLLCGMYVDKRLAGIQAVQTLSRLNRAHPGKETTYVLDFVNDAADVLAAFKTYHTTAELSDVTDPNLVYNLRAKLDAAGHYDEFEVDRVVTVELKANAKQSELVAAVEPVVDRLHKRYKAAQLAGQKDELDALRLFQSDMAAFQRLYTYLSQIFDYGNTAIEKRSIFYRQVLRLLEFGREREGIDLSKVVLTHHTLKNQGKRAMPLIDGENPKLAPITEVGSGKVQDKQKAFLEEIIKKVNDLFEGDLTPQDKLVYVNNVIMGKLLESEILKQQAANNTKEQFANSPDLQKELMNAIIGALEAHTAMSTQALESQRVQDGLKDVLLGPAQLYETLRR